MPAPVTVRDYWDQLRLRARQMSHRFGFDIRTASHETRGLASVTAAELAVLHKLLVDKGLVSWAELDDAFDQGLAGGGWTRIQGTEAVTSDPGPLEPGSVHAEDYDAASDPTPLP